LEAVYEAHCNLGHLNYSALKEMIKNVKDLEHLDFPWTREQMEFAFPCDACKAAKLKDIHHSKSSGRPFPTKAGEYISADLSGKINIAEQIHGQTQHKLYKIFHNTIGSWEYFGLIIDHWSKRVFVEVFADKTQGPQWILRTVQSIGRQSGNPVKKIFVDKGTDVMNAQVRQRLIDDGVDIVEAPTNHKERQGQVERYMYTIWDSVRAMLHHAKLHTAFAKYALYYATDMVNLQTPPKHKIRKEIASRYELFSKQKPTARHRYTFGSDAYVKNEKEHKTDTRGIAAIFLGFSQVSEMTHTFLTAEHTPRIVESNRFQIINGRFTFMREDVAPPEEAKEILRRKAKLDRLDADTHSQEDSSVNPTTREQQEQRQLQLQQQSIQQRQNHTSVSATAKQDIVNHDFAILKRMYLHTPSPNTEHRRSPSMGIDSNSSP